jgi:hypothetical protein
MDNDLAARIKRILTKNRQKKTIGKKTRMKAS